MRAATLAFLLGVLAAQTHRHLPDPFWSQFLALTAAVALGGRARALRLAAIGACGFLWAVVHGHVGLGGMLPAALDGERFRITGDVVGVPETRDGVHRFELAPREPGIAAGSFGHRPRIISLRWYRPPSALPRAGEAWQLRVRLRVGQWLANPGGFDHVGWLFARGVGASGYVVDDPGNARLEPAGGLSVSRLREHLAGEIEAVLEGRPGAGIARALALGLRDRLGEPEWAVLRRTGTGHLVAISGLHVGLVAGLGLALGLGVGRVAAALGSPVPAGIVGTWLGLVLALVYALLAGLTVPTQRALVSVAVVAAARLGRRRVAAGDVLAGAALGVIVVDPLAVLGSGFWLSFGAVGLLLWLGVGRRSPGGRGRRVAGWARLQVGLSLGLAPLTVGWFGEHPLVAPVANLLAVPWFSLIVVPVLLLGVGLLPAWPDAGAVVLQVAAGAIAVAWHALTWLAQAPPLLPVSAAPGIPAIAAAALGVLILAMPRGIPGRLIGVLWLAPLLVAAPARPPPGGARLTMLDVGQGLALVVETHRGVLVYDTGPRYGPGRDAGERVVVPFLRARGASQVDVLVLSHGDSDHAGGLGSLLDALPVVRKVGDARMLGPGAEPCRDGAQWESDGVRFALMRATVTTRGDNDGSCVLLIEAGGVRALLAGDIEAVAERDLVDRHGAGIGADVLTVPHHGSRTSSTASFLDRVAPRLGLASYGSRNRFGFPHGEVAARYRERGVVLVDTAAAGAITLELGPDGRLSAPRAHRREVARYWHRLP